MFRFPFCETNLIPGILEKVDEGRIALTPAVELSYLAEAEQKDLLETMESEDCTPSLSQAIQLKQLSQTGKLDMDESEWVMYPDPSIPAIVSEELWDRANALYKERRKEMMSKSSGSSYHNRYPYSTKIICEEHGTTFHRQVLTSAKGSKEVWLCKVYRQQGKAACSVPQIRSSELDQIMAEIFTEMVKDKNAIIDSLVTVITNVPKEMDFERMLSQVESGIATTKQKKDRLLDLHIAGAITIEEFKERNDSLNDLLKEQESQLAAIHQEQAKAGTQELDIDAIRKELNVQLSFEGGINTALVATILDKIIVKKESTKEEIHLDIYLKLGHKYEAIYSPQNVLTGINPPRRCDARANSLWRTAPARISTDGWHRNAAACFCIAVYIFLDKRAKRWYI